MLSRTQAAPRKQQHTEGTQNNATSPGHPCARGWSTVAAAGHPQRQLGHPLQVALVHLQRCPQSGRIGAGYLWCSRSPERHSQRLKRRNTQPPNTPGCCSAKHCAASSLKPAFQEAIAACSTACRHLNASCIGLYQTNINLQAQELLALTHRSSRRLHIHPAQAPCCSAPKSGQAHACPCSVPSRAGLCRLGVHRDPLPLQLLSLLPMLHSRRMGAPDTRHSCCSTWQQ